ncbi:hypothetical protein BDV93DRAFT_602189 [Ceratobasidium sp. AG-I]|nr:hypothetical protein BDV93DRAFT_602189 [Ceratobasidium sp. AG-I]
MYRLLVLLTSILYYARVNSQLVKGSFGLVTTDPICIQCDYATVAWYGGVAPYILAVSGQRNSYKIANVGVTSTSQMKWHVNFPTGTKLWFQLRDGNGTDIYTNIVSVSTSSDATCVNVTNPMVTDSSTTTSLVLTSLPSSSSTASAGGAPDSSEESNHGSLGAIIGGIIGGISALILLLLFLWYRRRNKRRRSVSTGGLKLDMEEDSSGMVVEPFLPNTQAQPNNNPRPSKAVTSSTNLLAAHAESSPAGSSSAMPSSSAPSTQEAPLPEARTAVASRKHPRPSPPEGPVQENDAGVRLMGGVRPEEPATVPPAYDNSWRA